MVKHKIKVILVDDEPLSRNILKLMLAEKDDVEILGEAENAESALMMVAEKRPDLVFLDVEMPGKNGIELFDRFQSLQIAPLVIFTTGHMKYALDAIERQAFAYLLKPIETVKLYEALERARIHTLEVRMSLKINLKTRNGYLIAQDDEIMYALAHGNYTDVFLKCGKTTTITMQIGKFLEVLPAQSFIRVGRSMLINGAYVREINQSKLICTLASEHIEKSLSLTREGCKSLLRFIK